MIVKKFGGTSIGTAERMQKVASMLRDDTSSIIVLSAIGGTTDQLEACARMLYMKEHNKAAHLINELEKKYLGFSEKLFQNGAFLHLAKDVCRSHFNAIRNFSKDMFTLFEERTVLAQGELLTSALFKLYCDQINIPSELMPALDFMRLDTVGEPDRNYLKTSLNQWIAEHACSGIYITQGYICRNAFGEIDNLKRGGSDYTATLIASAIQAEEIQIWTDIDGMHNNDPSVVAHTRPIAGLSYTEAAELAYFGARILHPFCVQPARENNIPILLKNTLNPQAAGTRISAFSEKRDQIKAVAAKDGITAIKIKSGRMFQAYGFLRKVFEVFERYKKPIDMITTSEVAVSLTIDQDENLSEIIRELEAFGQVQVDKSQTIICIVGDFLEENHGYAARVFDALKDIPIRMVSYGGSKNNISLLVNSKDKKASLLALNKHVFGIN